jgi:hypothetical protein
VRSSQASASRPPTHYVGGLEANRAKTNGDCALAPDGLQRVHAGVEDAAIVRSRRGPYGRLWHAVATCQKRFRDSQGTAWEGPRRQEHTTSRGRSLQDTATFGISGRKHASGDMAILYTSPESTIRNGSQYAQPDRCSAASRANATVQRFALHYIHAENTSESRRTSCELDYILAGARASRDRANRRAAGRSRYNLTASFSPRKPEAKAYWNDPVRGFKRPNVVTQVTLSTLLSEFTR